MPKARTAFAALTLTATVGVSAMAGDLVVFEDSEFLDTDWSAALIFDSTSGASFQANRVASGGFSGAYRETRHEFDSGSMIVAHLDLDATYEPSSEGAISELWFEFDLIQRPASGYSVRYRPMLRQNGVWYECDCGDLVWDPVWRGFSYLGLTEEDFVKQDIFRTGEAAEFEHPDFSASGSVIEFGYKSHNSATSDDPQVRVTGLDNWKATIVPDGVVVSTPGQDAAATNLLRLVPNPFQGSVALDLATTEVGRLSIYDASGRMVWHRVVGSGSQAATWDGHDLSGRAVPPGTYFVELVAGSDRQVDRLLRLR